jgi:hypothetical protein
LYQAVILSEAKDLRLFFNKRLHGPAPVGKFTQIASLFNIETQI